MNTQPHETAHRNRHARRRGNEMPDTELKVTGMMCEGCTGSVENVVAKVSNVSSVKAEFAPADKVTVAGEGYDIEEVKAAITKAGFTVE